MFSVFSICSQWHPQTWGQIIPGEHRAGNQPVLHLAHPTTRTQWVQQSCLWSPRYPPPHLVFSHHFQHGFLWLPTVRSLAHLEASTNALLS